MLVPKLKSHDTRAARPGAGCGPPRRRPPGPGSRCGYCVEISEWRAMATFLAARKLSRMGIDSDRSRSRTVLDRVSVSVRSTSKSSGSRAHRRARPAPGDGVAERPLDVEVERVAALVGLGGVAPLVARPLPLQRVAPDPVLVQALEQVAQGVAADGPQAPGRQLQPALAVLDEPGLGRAAGPARPAAPGCGRRRRPAGPGPRRGRPRPGRRATAPTTAGSRAGRAAPSRVHEVDRLGHPHGVALAPASGTGLPQPRPGRRPGGAAGGGRPASAGPCRRGAGPTAPASWARCSGDSELRKACMAAMRRAMASSSSSRVCGFSGKKSPYWAMKPSKSGSSPLARSSSMAFRAASMSLNRAISSGETSAHRLRHLLGTGCRGAAGAARPSAPGSAGPRPGTRSRTPPGP